MQALKNLKMTDYLLYKFEDSRQFVDTFDELPLWSASFGLLLLKHLEYKPGLTILDIGSGTGFPLMEIAGRFGSTCTCYGLDVWTNANNRAKQKAINYGLKNVTIIEGTAEAIPLEDNNIDLIVSNLGINNFDDPPAVFNECYRVLKPGGKLALTTNILGHWKEFYSIFETTLIEAGKEGVLLKLKEQQEHRGTVKSIQELFTNSGFSLCRHFTDIFEMKFTDGSAFLNHYFIKTGWLGPLLALPDEADKEVIFRQLEQHLNAYAQQNGCLALTVPMLYMEALKH